MSTLAMRQRMFGDASVTSCLRTRLLVQRFLDAETDATTAARMSRHLLGCPGCGRTAQVYRDIKASLRGRPPSPPQPAVDRLVEFASTLTGRRN